MSSTHSKACCEAPVPATVSDYKEKGEWIDVDGEKTYIAGDKTATRAIIWVYDIFGYSHQTLRGADIVAESLSSSKGGSVAVIVPDWFDGTVADKAWVPPVSDEQKQKLGNFIQTKASPELVVPRVLKFAQALQNQANFSQVKKLGIFGFCWGGKLASIACQQSANNIFTAAVQTSPARIDPEEAKNIAVPMALLASKDEDPETLTQFFDNLPTADKLLEKFDTQIHGWMSGRGDLADPKVKAEYERGYKVAVEFFDKYLL